jgi:hypothetical protein
LGQAVASLTRSDVVLFVIFFVQFPFPSTAADELCDEIAAMTCHVRDNAVRRSLRQSSAKDSGRSVVFSNDSVADTVSAARAHGNEFNHSLFGRLNEQSERVWVSTNSL